MLNQWCYANLLRKRKLNTNSYTLKLYLSALKVAVLFGLLLVCFIGQARAETAEEKEQVFQNPSGQVEPRQKSMSVVVIRVGGYFTDKPGANMLSLSGEMTKSICEITDTLTEIASDKSVDGVLFNFENPSLSWAHVDQLRRAIGRLRDAGKKTYAYVEVLDQINYLLACSCDQIIMTPTGQVMLTGLAGETLYFKNLLDKFGMQIDVVHIGQYKSTPETLTRSGPSEAQLRQINSLFDCLYDHLLETIAESRAGIPSVRQSAQLVDQGPFPAEQALQAGLIDMVMYREEFLEKLGQQNDSEISLRFDYDESQKVDLQLDNPFAMLNIFQKLLTEPKEQPGDAIAVVYVDGPIMLGESSDGWGGSVVGARTIRTALAESRTDDDVKAVVVRINSPGGSAVASDIIYNAVRQTAEVKPVIVSMGDMAASGGYYVACGGHTIVADASTITGSIGVWGGKLVLGDLFDKLGITTYSFQRGRHAQRFNLTKPFTPIERFDLAKEMCQVYETFKNCVVQSRGDRLKDSIESLAQGKVYTGRVALSVGLVDKIGDLHDAIEMAAGQANIEKYHIRTLPRPKNIMELVEELLTQRQEAGSDPVARLLSLGQGLKNGGTLPAGSFDLLKGGDLQRIWYRTAYLLNLLRQEQMLLVSPYEIVIR